MDFLTKLYCLILYRNFARTICGSIVIMEYELRFMSEILNLWQYYTIEFRKRNSRKG